MEANFERFVKLALKVDVRMSLAQFVLGRDQVSIELLGTECHLKQIPRLHFGGLQLCLSGFGIRLPIVCPLALDLKILDVIDSRVLKHLTKQLRGSAVV